MNVWFDRLRKTNSLKSEMTIVENQFKLISKRKRSEEKKNYNFFYCFDLQSWLACLCQHRTHKLAYFIFFILFYLFHFMQCIYAIMRCVICFIFMNEQINLLVSVVVVVLVLILRSVSFTRFIHSFIKFLEFDHESVFFGFLILSLAFNRIDWSRIVFYGYSGDVCAFANFFSYLLYVCRRVVKKPQSCLLKQKLIFIYIIFIRLCRS